MHHRNAHQRKVRRSGNMLKEKLGIEQNSITHLLASGQRDVHQPPSLYHHHPPSPLLLLLYSIFSTTPHLFCLLYAWCTCIWNSTCSLSVWNQLCEDVLILFWTLLYVKLLHPEYIYSLEKHFSSLDVYIFYILHSYIYIFINASMWIF